MCILLRTQSVRGSLVPRPVRAIRVTRGGLEPSAVLGEFFRQARQVTSHLNSPRTTGNEAVCLEHAGEWERTGEEIFRWQICFTEFYRKNFFMNAKGRVKEDGTFKFYKQQSSRRGRSYHARRTTHDVRRTTHDALTHEPRGTTHDARRTTHPPSPISQSLLVHFFLHCRSFSP